MFQIQRNYLRRQKPFIKIIKFLFCDKIENNNKKKIIVTDQYSDNKNVENFFRNLYEIKNNSSKEIKIVQEEQDIKKINLELIKIQRKQYPDLSLKNIFEIQKIIENINKIPSLENNSYLASKVLLENLKKFKYNKFSLKVEEIIFLLKKCTEQIEWISLFYILNLLSDKELKFDIDNIKEILEILQKVQVSKMRYVDNQKFEFFITNILKEKIIEIFNKSGKEYYKDTDFLFCYMSILKKFRIYDEDMIKIFNSKIINNLKENHLKNSNSHIFFYLFSRGLSCSIQFGNHSIEFFSNSITMLEKVNLNIISDINLISLFENLCFFKIVFLYENKTKVKQLDYGSIYKIDYNQHNDVFENFSQKVFEEILKKDLLFKIKRIDYLAKIISYLKIFYPNIDPSKIQKAEKFVKLNYLIKPKSQKKNGAVEFVRNYLKKKNIKFKEEIRVENFLIDFLVEFPLQKIVIEIDGPLHYMNNGDSTFNNKYRNIIIGFHFKIIEIRADLFQYFINDKKAEIILDNFFQQNDTQFNFLISEFTPLLNNE